MKKRVLLVIGTELQNAGVPGVIMALVRHLHHRFIFDLLQFSTCSGYYDEEFKSYGGDIYSVDLLNYDDHKLVYPYRAIQIRKALRNIFRQKKYDIIHCHCGIESGVCLPVAKKADISCRIVHAHGMYIRKGKNIILRGYIYWCKRLIYKNATKCLSCSSAAIKTIFRGASAECVRNPVDIKCLKNIQKIPHIELELLQIGYFNENKNQLFSAQLLKKMREQDISVHLTYIGYKVDDAYFANLQAYIKDNLLEPFITFLPSNADKREVFARVDYTLLPSRSEGLPLVALESQAAGVPCLMSDCLSRDADLGGVIFVPYNDFKAWAEELQKRHDFDWEEIYEKMESLSTEKFAKNIGEFYES